MISKTDILPRDYGKLISNASLIRNRSDYEDFYICSVENTQKLVAGAEEFFEVCDGVFEREIFGLIYW